MSRNLPDQPAGPKRKPGTAASGKKSGSISAANRAAPQPAETDDGASPWVLRLFVAGQSPKSLLAYSNLKKICEQYLKGNYRIELVDLVKEPHLAQKHQIVAVPTLVRQLPEPVKRVIGDLSNHERALVGIDLNVA